MSLLRPGARDPRHIVTPDAFEVSSELLGRPLAKPWRRGFALLADLLCIFLLTQLGSLSAALAVTALFLIVFWQKTIERTWLRWAWRLSATFASLLVFIGVLSVLETSESGPVRVRIGGEGSQQEATYEGITTEQWAEFGKAFAVQDPDDQADLLEDLVEDMVKEGAPAQEIQPLIDAVELPPEVRLELEDELDLDDTNPRPPTAAPEAIAPEKLASLLESYAAALRADDPAQIDTSGQPVQELLSTRATRRLEQQVERLRQSTRELTRENLELRDQVESPSWTRIFSTAAADLGLTIGWSGFYFTCFLAGWRGRTPGKWFFGLRVVRLDERPLGVWRSFERFAGYTAGLATGLLGFLQIFWDANRQGIQDKIVGTVVVFEPRSWLRFDRPVSFTRRTE